MSRKLKVVIVAPGPHSQGGISQVIKSIHFAFDNDPEFKLTWLSTHKSGTAFKKIICFVQSILRSFGVFPGYDIVHIHSAAWTSFARKSAFFWVAKLFSKPVIWHFHAANDVFQDFFSGRNLLSQYGRLITKKCQQIVVLSDSWKDLAAQYFSEDKIKVIYNPVQKSLFQKSNNGTRFSKRILYLAHLISRKGYEDLLYAFASIEKKIPDCELVFAGSGEILQAKNLAKSFGVQDNVIFLGWISDENKKAELAKATIFCLPSRQEGLPIGMLEAMACQVPVVVTPVGGIPDVIKDGENGLLVTPGDRHALAQAIQRLLDDKHLRQRLATNAYIRVQEFRPEIISGHWKNLYRGLQRH